MINNKTKKYENVLLLISAGLPSLATLQPDASIEPLLHQGYTCCDVLPRKALNTGVFSVNVTLSEPAELTNLQVFIFILLLYVRSCLFFFLKFIITGAVRSATNSNKVRDSNNVFIGLGRRNLKKKDYFIAKSETVDLLH